MNKILFLALAIAVSGLGLTAFSVLPVQAATPTYKPIFSHMTPNGPVCDWHWNGFEWVCV
jgi:hypothetical protein